MTKITISDIKITSLDTLSVWINGHETYLGLFETSQLLKNMTEKKVNIVSRDYHKHNDHESFKNNFMVRLVQLLDNANHNRIYGIDFSKNKERKFMVPFWVIDEIKEIPLAKDNSTTIIQVTIRNLLNEKLEDN